MGRYYEIALNWNSVSDELVNEFKDKVKELLNLDVPIKVRRVVNWNYWTCLDIYVLDMSGRELKHITIDRDDIFDLQPTQVAVPRPIGVR